MDLYFEKVRFMNRNDEP